ncbi:MAG: glycosyltransferase 87 family protein [Vulcanimicrobiota bacterium]
MDRKNRKNTENREHFTDSLWFLMLLTFLAMVPQYVIRSSYSMYYYFYHKFTTYPGDLWYCWNHYLSKGFPYPVEYPVGMRIIFTFIYRVKPDWFNYEWYMLSVSIFFGIFALATTCFLYYLVKKTHRKTKKLITYWILAPTFLFYALLNTDLLTLFTIVAAAYLFMEEDYYLAAAMLGLGTAIKVFPIFLTPLFFFQCPRKKRWLSVASFLGIWLVFNVPFMLSDWKSWISPYLWQIKHNIPKDASHGSYWWIAYKLLGPENSNWVGRLSLLFFASLYGLFLWKKWDLPFARKAMGVMILFLMTDRVYSPQYNLYLLPFLVLVDYRVDLKWFYMLEIPNFIQVAFLFFWRANPVFLQILILIKYIALILLFLQLVKTPVELDTDREFRLNMQETELQKS